MTAGADSEWGDPEFLLGAACVVHDHRDALFADYVRRMVECGERAEVTVKDGVACALMFGLIFVEMIVSSGDAEGYARRIAEKLRGS